MLAAMEERKACALLKARFEAAGFAIEDNRMFDEDGIRFEMDGFDPAKRVGFEYITEEAGDSWDVDDDVISELAERHRNGDLHVLVVTETDAPDADSLGQKIDKFLDGLRERGMIDAAAKKKPAAKKKKASASPRSPRQPRTRDRR